MQSLGLTGLTGLMGLLPVEFERPGWLVLLLLIAPAFYIAWRSVGGLSRTKAFVTFAFRTLVIVLLTMVLSEPIWAKEGEDLTVMVVFDRSQSVPQSLQLDARDFLNNMIKSREKTTDRVGMISVGRDVSMSGPADQRTLLSLEGGDDDLQATNLAAGVRHALAAKPDDSSLRILLVSDGNETMDSLLEEARAAQANHVPIDVLPMRYEQTGEVVFERLIAPARTRQGDAHVKLVLRNFGSKEATGKLSLSVDGEPFPLGGEDGTSLPITIDPNSPVALPVTIPLTRAGTRRINAVFESDDPNDNVQNNFAKAVTFVSGAGSVLVVSGVEGEADHFVRTLRDRAIEVESRAGAGFVRDSLDLIAYDAIVLANVPYWQIDKPMDQALNSYVRNHGGGLVMLGGPDSFGAGQWTASKVAEALPVKLDPPITRQMSRGALVLVMHSTEMANPVYWGQRVANAAIDALSRLDYVGIVEFNYNVRGLNIDGCSWAHELQPVGDKSAAKAAVKNMVVGDMPSFAPSINLALQGLQNVKAGQKHIIIISDGDPSPPGAALLQDLKDNNISVTTVMVGGHGTMSDRNAMQHIADTTGGKFHQVNDPQKLPQIFFKEAQIVARTLIQEAEAQYHPSVITMPAGPTGGVSTVPPIEGYVLTVPREDLAEMPIFNAMQQEVSGEMKSYRDPIFAYWNYGIGRSIAFTPDVSGRWAPDWMAWDDYKAFWATAMEWVMRSPSSGNVTINTRIDGEIAHVEVEALEADASFLNFMKSSVSVTRVETGDMENLSLQQVGPGRYHGQFRVDEAGAYLVNLSYAGGTAEDPISGSVSAAVTVPYPREFRAVRDNAALLQQVADMTGGRVYELGDTSPPEMFSWENVGPSKTEKPIWHIVAIIAASLFVLDVAARRLAIDPKWVRGVLARLTGKRQEKSDATVAAWKRARSQRKVAARAEVEPEQETFRAPADADAAFDVAAETSGEDRPHVKRPEQAGPTGRDAGADDEDDGEYTSRLLKAKRRARGETDDADGGREGGDG